MFVTDTVDAIYPPNEWHPQAIMDRLGEILAPHRSLRAVIEGDPTSAPSTNGRPQPRKPSLTLKKIDTIADLEPFFSSVSLSAYESIYHSAGKVDWIAVEAQLLTDLFEGSER